MQTATTAEPASAISLSPSQFAKSQTEDGRLLGKHPFIRFHPYFFFTVTPDVTRFGQEIGSIMMVAGVIVVIADLQQKTAGPKIELLQTVKKGEEERRGRRSFDHQQKWHGWRGGRGRGRPQPRQKGLVRSREIRVGCHPSRTY